MLSRSRLKRKKKIRAVSKKRAAELQKYSKLRDKFLLDQPWCEIGADGCTRKSQEVHHIKGRYGKWLNDRKWFVATCRSCHSYVHNHPAWSRKHTENTTGFKHEN